MDTVPHSPPRSRVGVVSYALTLTVSARRIAARLRVDAAPFVHAAVDAYRGSGVAYDGARALRAFVDGVVKGGGGVRA